MGLSSRPRRALHLNRAGRTIVAAAVRPKSGVVVADEQGAERPRQPTMAELLEESSPPPELRRGELVEGQVMRADPDGLLVSVGHKIEGVVPAREMRTVDGDPAARYQVGDTVLVYVLDPAGEALLRKEVDVLIFDSRPALAVADASILAAKVDGTMLVVAAGHTRVQALREAHEALGRAQTRVLGAILNKLTERGRGYYYYPDYYSASDNGRNGHGTRRFPCGRKSRKPEESKSFA